MTAADLEAQRALFEAWQASEGSDGFTTFNRREDLLSWATWQAALAAQAPVVRQEPVAYKIEDKDGVAIVRLAECINPRRLIAVKITPLYAAAPVSQPAALTDEQIESLRELASSWMSETGRDAMEDWIDTQIGRAASQEVGK